MLNLSNLFYWTKLSLSAFLCLDELKWNQHGPNFPISLHRWRNYWIRGVLSLPMISGFFLMIYLGPVALILVVSDDAALTLLDLNTAISLWDAFFLRAEKETHHFRRPTLLVYFKSDLFTPHPLCFPRTLPIVSHRLWLSKSSASKKSLPSVTEFTVPMNCPGSGH